MSTKIKVDLPNREVLERMSREELINKIGELQGLVNAYVDDKENTELLNFSWTGNLGHWYWNVRENKVTFNSLKVTTLGYTMDEVPDDIGFQFFTDKIHPEDYEVVMDNMRQHMAGKSNVYEVEYRIKTKSGEYKWFYDRGKISKWDEEGKPVLLAGIVFDITGRKLAENQLLELTEDLQEENELKDKFISILAHDLRNPVGFIASYIRLIIDNFEEYNRAGTLRNKLEYIRNVSSNAYGLLNNLIYWVRNQNGKIFVNPETINIKDVVSSVKDSLFSQSDTKKIVIESNILGNEYIFSDPVIIETVLRNLISNAIKFSNEKSIIQILVDEKNGDKIFMVKDHGKGMPQEMLDEIVKYGASSSEKGTKGEKGTGMGLRLCRDLIEKLGGAMWGESAPGAGTSMYFKVPGEHKE
ncbi:MAG: ATP-binding protein [Bacteroidota bacterium]